MPAKKKPARRTPAKKKQAKLKPLPKVGVKPTEKDWKAVALILRQNVEFAIANMILRGGTGIILDTRTGESRHWKEWFADSYELIPGHKIDREAMHAMDLPKHARLKFFREREKKAKAKQPDT